jgi:hypothetical protein
MVLIAVTWHLERRTRSAGHRPNAMGLVLVASGTLLYIVTALWLKSLGTPASFDDLRLRVWLHGLQGFAWPIAILGLGLLTYPRLSTAFADPPIAAGPP